MDEMKRMLVGFALADAMGVPVEFKSRLELKSNPVVDMRGYGTYQVPPGTWSDDTTMTVATMESIARLGTIDYDDLMKNFAAWYTDGDFTVNGRFDIGHTTRAGVKRYLKGTNPLECGETDSHSNGNGSLMRMVPIGMYLYALYGYDFPDEAMDVIHNVSALTHAHPISQMGCGFYCLILSGLLNGLPPMIAFVRGLYKGIEYYRYRPNFSKRLEAYARLFDKGFSRLPERDIQSSGYVVHTLEAAMWCLLNTRDYKSLILKAINLGEDTDTVAAVASGLGGVVYDYDYHDLPKGWLDKLRKKKYLEDIEEAFINRLEAMR